MFERYFTEKIDPLIYKSNQIQIIIYLRQKNILKHSMPCLFCSTLKARVKNENSTDKYSF